MSGVTTTLTGSHSPILRASRRWNKSDSITTDGGSVLNQDFKEFVQLFNDNQVRYLIVGGYAVAFHGHPRYTKDLDVWVERRKSQCAND